MNKPFSLSMVDAITELVRERTAVETPETMNGVLQYSTVYIPDSLCTISMGKSSTLGMNGVLQYSINVYCVYPR